MFYDYRKCPSVCRHVTPSDRNFRTLQINVLPISSLESLQNSVFNISQVDTRLSFGRDILMSLSLHCPKVPTNETKAYPPQPLTTLGFSL